MTLKEAIFPKVSVSNTLEAVCRRFHVRRLDVFGSATRPDDFDAARSDLDFFVVFEPLSPGDYANAWFGLSEALQKLAGRPVDLVTEPALENPYFRRRIEAERQVLFVAL